MQFLLWVPGRCGGEQNKNFQSGVGGKGEATPHPGTSVTLCALLKLPAEAQGPGYGQSGQHGLSVHIPFLLCLLAHGRGLRPSVLLFHIKYGCPHILCLDPMVCT